VRNRRLPGGRLTIEAASAKLPRQMQDDVAEIATILRVRYGAYPDESASPVLDQLVWFLLSTRTTVENCDTAYSALRARFPRWEDAANAKAEEIGLLLRPAGLFRTRAANLLATLAAIREEFGSADLEGLRTRDDRGCEAFLLSLPGVGLKVARCVLSFGLGRPAFAVDAHIWRVSRRLGWHSFPGEAPTARGADTIQELARAVPDPISFHVNLIRLGREFCPAGEPRCEACPVVARCETGRTEAIARASTT
jgi:endonuclease III